VSNVYDILSSIGYNLSDRGKEYRCLPLYRDSDDPTVLKIKKDTGEWYDFKLCIGGKLESLVAKTLGKDETQAKEYLNSRDYVEARPVSRPKVEIPKIYPSEWLERLTIDDRYWNERGVSTCTLENFRGGVAKQGSLYGRYVFPIFKRDGIVGFAGRDVLENSSKQRPKWKLIGPKKTWVYPAKNSYSYIKDTKQVIFVESIGDMLKLWESGIKNTLVLFGLNLSEATLNFLLSVEPKSIVIALNNDESNAGNNASHRISKKLSKYFSSSRLKINLPFKNDFGDMGVSEIRDWNKKNG